MSRFLDTGQECLNDDASPIDRTTSLNLKFLVGLRHEIEHEMSRRLDTYLSGRYQACCLNYNRYIRLYSVRNTDSTSM